jgi:photosystem II stability/assembly factor-like uncharacterized protein
VFPITASVIITATFTTTNLNVLTLAIDPTDTDTLYAGRGGAGVAKTINGGLGWAPFNAGFGNPATAPANFVIQTLAIDPASPQTVYAGTAGGGVFKTINGGLNWQPFNAGFGNPATAPANFNIRALAIDPASPLTVYAGTAGGGVFKTTNGGLNWQPFNAGFGNPATAPANFNIRALAIDPTTPQTVYAGTVGGGVFKTINGGLNWQPFNAGFGNPATAPANFVILALAIDPTTPQTVYAGTAGGGIFKTINGGLNWQPFNAGLTNLTVLTLAIDPATPQTVYAGTAGGGVFKTTNGGLNWLLFSSGLTNLLITDIAIDPATPTTLYASSAVAGVFRSDNGGLNWIAASSGL